MRIVIAPDKFKSSLYARSVCLAVADGLRRVDPAIELDLCPMADGGDGTVAALSSGLTVRREVTGPLPDMKVSAEFALLDNGATAVIEMAAASGLKLLQSDQRDPMRTTTFGTGELMMAAAEMGVKRIIVGLGGSATIDAGIGCAQACGLPVLMKDGEPVSPTEPLTGADLDRIVLIKHGRGSPIERVRIEAACDVDIPLYDAASMFGPQKGASPEQVKWFDDQLRRLAVRCGKEQIAKSPGAGAAGGLGFALGAFFGAILRPGFDLVAESVGLRQRLKGADLCITGEGRLDEGSLRGKAAVGVARICRELGVPCVGLIGSAGSGAERIIDAGMTAYFSIAEGPASERHMTESAAELLSKAAANVLRLFSNRL